jgi:tRNA threonylcarbamoyladenosine biosynthesis protein TsaB
VTLAIDASTYTGDVAVLDGERVLAEESTAMKDAAHERLMPAVALVLERAMLGPRDVGRVVCGAGPGSFTSLRIAGGIAKGIATGVACPLFAAPSMALVVGGADLAPGRYLVAIDALRGEFYVGLYDVKGTSVDEVEPARLVTAAELLDRDLAGEYGARLVSPSHLPEAIVALPRGRSVARIEALLHARGPVQVATWEPSYGRLAEAQLRWETAHGRPLPAR